MIMAKKKEVKEIKALPTSSISEAELVSAQKIISVILKNALEGRATDIHIEPGPTEVRVRYRVDGVLHSSLTLSLSLMVPLVQQIRKMVGLPLISSFKPEAASYQLRQADSVYNILVYFLPMVEGEKVVLHLISAYDQPQTLADLGFLDYHLSSIESNLSSGGLVLVTGKVDCGKTTTLYTLLNILNQEEINITTLEDPVERYLAGINQLALSALAGASLNESLQLVLRQEPDVLMIDVPAGGAVVELASWVASLKRKVFCSLSTSDVLTTLRRLKEIGLSPFLLGESLRLIISQRLVRRICQDCRVEVMPPQPQLKLAKQVVASQVSGLLVKDNLTFYQGAGCPNCGQTGYKGRLVVAEILAMTPAVQKYLVEQPEFKVEDFKRAVPGFISLAEDGIIKASQGLTTLAEVAKIIA